MTDDRLALAECLAREGGAIALKHFRRTGFEQKTIDERVTEADHEVQGHILEAVRGAFPGDGFIGEEGEHGEVFKERADAGFCWIIDPIDGTNNFAIGLPVFVVSVGVFRGGCPYAGVVYDPCRDELYRALRGAGAWRDGEGLAVAAAPVDPNAMFGLPSLVAPPLPRYAIGWFERHKCRDLGALALQMTYVAAGYLHWTIGFRSKIWDFAAASALVLEAGGRVTDLSGNDLFPADLAAESGANTPMLASNGAAHDALIEQIAEG